MLSIIVIIAVVVHVQPCLHACRILIVGIGVLDPERKVRSDQAAVGRNPVSLIACLSAPGKDRSVVGYRDGAVAGRVAGGVKCAVRCVEPVIECAVPSECNGDRLAVELAVRTIHVSGVHPLHVMLLACFVNTVVVFVYPYLDRPWRLIIGVGVVHTERVVASTLCAVRLNTVDRVTGFAGPGKNRRLRRGRWSPEIFDIKSAVASAADVVGARLVPDRAVAFDKCPVRGAGWIDRVTGLGVIDLHPRITAHQFAVVDH